MEYYAVCEKGYVQWLSVFETKEQAQNYLISNKNEIVWETDMPKGWLGEMDSDFLDSKLEAGQIYKINIEKI